MKKNTKKQFEKSKSKVQKLWLKHKAQKQKIELSKFSRATKEKRKKKLLSTTKQKIHKVWTDYQILKFNSSNSFLKKIHEEKTKNGTIKTYLSSWENYNSFIRGINLILKHDNIQYILVVFEIKLLDTEQNIFISSSYKPFSLLQFLPKENIIELTKESILQKHTNDFSNKLAELKTNDDYINLTDEMIRQKAYENQDLKYDLSGGFEIVNITFKVYYSN